MKKYFLSIVALAAMLFATSCQESLVEPQLAGPTTFTVQLPDAMGTKAFGEASAVKQLLVEVYPQNGESVIYQTVEQGNGQFEVSLNLIQDQAYDILFWAQTANGYVVVSGNETDGYTFGSLREVPMNSKYLNNDNGAAFFHAEKGFVPNGTSTTITLVRPFAQLNLGTTPASLITDAGEYELVSSAITVTGMANSFNVFSGEGFGNAVATYNFNSQPVPNPNDEVLSVANDTYEYVSMNYLSVLGNEKALVDIEANIVVKDAADAQKTINHKFTSVPVQENYRTNIVGNLISSTTDFNVVVDADFAEDANENPLPDNDYFVVDNVNKAHEALQAGETYIAINSIRNGESVLDLDYTSNTTLYIQLPDTDASLTIQGSNVKELYLSVPNTNATNRGLALVINTPNAHVELDGDGGFFQSIVATTSNNTLVLNGVVVEEVVVEQGNVVVENKSAVGEIEAGANAGNITIYLDETSEVDDVDTGFTVIEEEEGDIRFITSAAKLQQLAELVNGGNNFAGQIITLLADIDLNNVEWTPIGTEAENFAGTFDGNGHTIKNLTIVETEAKEGKAFIGFFGYAKDATINNLTFENVYLNIACLDIDHSQGHIGAVAGSLEGTSIIQNVTVKGDIKVEATVTANGASRVAVVAGGNSYGNVTMKEVHVIANEGSYLKANNNVGALAGQLQGIAVFENCSSNIDVTGTKFFAGGLIGIAAGNHTFTNCQTTGDVTITAGREGRANDQYRVGGIAGGWADGKTKVCTLTGCSYTGTVSGKNADGSVAEPLDYAGYVGRGYTLANCAGSKVIIDGVEYVQASNNVYGIYIVNGIYEIATPAALKWLADEVNNGRNNFAGQTITLLADIDLNNEGWTPIGNSSNRFKGTFDGNNHTISNLVVEGGSSSDQGLFGFTTDGEIKNLIVNNAKVSGRLNVGVVAGTPYTSKYTNIKVTGHVEVNGMAYVGGVAGKNAYANWEDILVKVDETSYVNANSVENGTAYRTYVGGVVGFNGEGGHSFTDITSNIDVKGSTCDVGGLFGIAHYGNNFVNCSSSGDVEIYAAEDIDSAEEIGGIAGVWNNQTDYQVTFTDCSFTGNLRTNVANVDLTDNLIVGAAYSPTGNGKLIIDDDVIRTVSKADELVAALEANENVLFLNDINIDPASMSNAYGATGINVKYGQTIDGNGYTLNIKGAGGTWDSGINTTGGVIKNLTVTGSFRGIFINHTSDHSEKVVLENVTITGTTYTISCDQGLYQGIEATNCTFNGWTSFAETAGEAKFVNCSFGEGNGYKYCRPYSKTEFVNCTFCPGYAVDQTQAEVTFTDCTWE
ncbi:MAG: hypothetical protein J6U71_00330 [Bacteroidales bacterium]|nr:hypothetical protein [Bacteroidales bacterium]